MNVPKLIHHIWVGSPIPHHLKSCIDSWISINPGWVHHLWIDGDFAWLQNIDLYTRAHTLVPPDAVGQFRADIARYEILRRYGGLYVDCDTVAHRPIDEALEGHDAWAAAEDANWVGNTYLASTPGHPVMESLVSGLAKNAEANKGRRPNKLSGPQYLTPVWRKHHCYVAEQKLFYPYGYSDIKGGTVPADVGDAYATHLWQHTQDTLERRGRRTGRIRRH